MVRRKAFVVPPLGGINTRRAKAGTTNIDRDPCNTLASAGKSQLSPAKKVRSTCRVEQRACPARQAGRTFPRDFIYLPYGQDPRDRP